MRLKGSGVVLIQRLSPIIEKSLGDEETIHVLTRTLCSFTSNARIAPIRPASFHWQLVPPQWQMLAVTGPALVYMSPEQAEPSQRKEVSSADIRAIFTLMYFPPRGLITTLFVIERFVDVVLPD